MKLLPYTSIFGALLLFDIVSSARLTCPAAGEDPKEIIGKFLLTCWHTRGHRSLACYQTHADIHPNMIDFYTTNSIL